MEIRDIRPAAEYLRRMAPTQSHEDRHNFQCAADFLTGLKLVEGSVVLVDVPLWLKGKEIGSAQLTVETLPDGDIAVSGHFKPSEDWRNPDNVYVEPQGRTDLEEPSTDIPVAPAEPLSPSEEDRVTDRLDSEARRRADERAARMPTRDDVLTDFVREQGGSRSDAAKYLFGDG